MVPGENMVPGGGMVQGGDNISDIENLFAPVSDVKSIFQQAGSNLKYRQLKPEQPTTN